jgi:Na+/H+-dicarboxylate symporter
MKLWKKVTIGLILGIICGCVFKEKIAFIKPIGEVFINLIKMVVTPLIFFSLISGITSISDSKTLGRVGTKSAIAFLSTTAFAIIIGLTIALIFEPGAGVNLRLDSNTPPPPQHPGFLHIVMGIIPDNALGAMVNGNVVQVVFFAIFTGLIVNAMGTEGRRIIDFCQIMAKMIFKMVSCIVLLSPYGAFAMSAWVVGTQGTDVLHGLAKLVICVVFSMFLQYLIFGVLIRVFAGLSPLPFYKKSFEYQVLAFSTSSSKATLSTTMAVCQNRLGISRTSTSFVLPLGAAINMDGMAIYLGMCAVFFAQATNTVLVPYDYAMIILTATLGSIGVAGIPAGSMMMLPMILAAIHLPIEGIALIAGIDRILDMLRTTINITGDATITLIVDKSEGKTDVDTYYKDN